MIKNLLCFKYLFVIITSVQMKSVNLSQMDRRENRFANTDSEGAIGK